MDADGVKIALGVLTGAITLAGGIFTFVNGRLNEAKSPDGRRNVTVITVGCLSLLATALGFFVIVVFNFSLACLPLFAVGFILQIVLVLMDPTPVTRMSLVTFGGNCAGFAMLISLAVAFNALTIVQGQIHELTQVNTEMIKLIGGLAGKASH